MHFAIILYSNSFSLIIIIINTQHHNDNGRLYQAVTSSYLNSIITSQSIKIIVVNCVNFIIIFLCRSSKFLFPFAIIIQILLGFQIFFPYERCLYQNICDVNMNDLRDGTVASSGMFTLKNENVCETSWVFVCNISFSAI